MVIQDLGEVDVRVVTPVESTQSALCQVFDPLRPCTIVGLRVVDTGMVVAMSAVLMRHDVGLVCTVMSW